MTNRPQNIKDKCDELIELLSLTKEKTAKTFTAVSALSSHNTSFYCMETEKIIDLIKRIRSNAGDSESLRKMALSDIKDKALAAKRLSDSKLIPVLELYRSSSIGKDIMDIEGCLSQLDVFIESLESGETASSRQSPHASAEPVKRSGGSSAKKSSSARSPSSIDEYISYAEKLINSHQWKNDADKSLRERLQKIKDKQNDKCVNFSVIGEYNTGKSTFINALMRLELLRSSYIEKSGTGTTVASTIIEYSKKPTLFVKKKKGGSNRINFNNNEDLSAALAKYAASSETAKEIGSVTLGYPVDILKPGLRIIDTPGTGNTVQWHSDVTIRAINELSDASVILIDPTKALPSSQIDFIKDHLSNVIHQCVFVITKTDMIRPAELPKVIQYVTQKISYEFDINDPFVITYASLNVLDDALGDKPANSRIQKMVNESYSNEVKMINYIINRKKTAQSNKLSLLLDDIYAGISENMTLISEDCKKEHELIEKTRQTDLKSFAEKEKKRVIRDFQDRSETIRCDVEQDSFGKDMITEYKKQVIGRLDECKTKGDIETYVNSRVKGECASRAELIHNAVSAYTKRLDGAATMQIALFDQRFQAEYKRLGLLPMKNNALNVPFENKSSGSISVYTGGVSSSIAMTVKDGYKTTGTGAVIGGLIGTLFGPGVGTAIGAAIGGFLFAPGVDSIRESAKNSLDKPLEEYFSGIVRSEVDALKQYSKTLEKYISDEIDNYFKNYNSFVESAIQADNKKQHEIEEKISSLENEMADIRKCRERLSSMRETFNR